MYRITLLLLLASSLSFTAHAIPAYRASMSTYSFWDNWSCRLGATGGLASWKVGLKKSKEAFLANGEIGIGYHLAEFNHSQAAIERGAKKAVSVYAGRGFITLESGIRYPYEEHLTSNSFAIKETYLVLPLRMRCAFPDFWDKNVYMTGFLSYNLRYLVQSRYRAGTDSPRLSETFRQDIPDLIAQFSDLKRWGDSLEVGTGVLWKNGFYIDLSFEYPLLDIFRKEVVCDPRQLNATFIHHERRSRSTSIYSLSIGVDLCMLLKSIEKAKTTSS